MANVFYLAPTANFVTKTLNGSISDSQTTITLNSTTNLQAPSVLVIDRVDASGTLTPNAREIISYTGISGNDLTGCARGAENSTARSHADSAVIETVPSVGMWNNLATIVASGLDSNGYLKAIASPVSIARMQIIQEAVTSIASITRAEFTQFALSSVASIARLNIGSLQGTFDGWVDANETWVYASASTFTIAGVDRTAVYTKGTKLKFTNTTGKYAVVVSSSFSTNTTVTIAVNTDYVIANAAISSPFYSYEANPQAFPTFFNFTPGFTGFSAVPTGLTCYSISGGVCTIWISADTPGASNATTFGFTAPIAAGAAIYFSGVVYDNSAFVDKPGRGAISGTAVTLGTTAAGGAWTGSNNKMWLGIIQYPI